MKWSSLGSGAAVLCAVHCLALPVLAGAASFTHDSPLENPWLENGMLGFTALVGYGTLGTSFRRHGNFVPLALLTLGLGLLLGAHHLFSGSASSIATVLGALCAVAAQRVNGGCPVSNCGDHCHHTEVERQVMTSGA